MNIGETRHSVPCWIDLHERRAVVDGGSSKTIKCDRLTFNRVNLEDEADDV